MTKIKNNSPLINITSTDQIKYVGEIPTCALTGDCSIDEANLSYLINLLLLRYCEVNNIIDADLSTVDITCIISANPDISIPENVTIETLATYFKNHICSIYTKISDLQSQVDSIKGIICLNDIVQTEQNEAITVDVLFNDFNSEVSGTVSVSIIEQPLNGTATISLNKIVYTPNEDFFGNEQITYQVTKGAYNCTARVSIRVNELITTQTINEIVAEQLLTVLQSNEYWDIGIPIGTKFMLSNVNLTDFDFTNITPGKGKTGTKWAKWAIVNGYNTTEDFRGRSLRGFDHTDSNYNLSGKNSGSDTQTLVIDNIPPHRHQSASIHLDNTFDNNAASNNMKLSSRLDDANIQFETIDITDNDKPDGGAGGGYSTKISYFNTGRGIYNIGDQDELKSSPDSFSTKNKVTTAVVVQKIL